jgi:hypothetical protein
MVPILRKHRPELKIFILDCAPTGLVAVTNLEPSSGTLADSYNSILDELRDLDLSSYTIERLWEEVPIVSSESLMRHPEDLALFLNIY